MNKKNERLAHSFTAQQISAIEEDFKSLHREMSPIHFTADNHLSECGYDGFDKSWAAVGP